MKQIFSCVMNGLKPNTPYEIEVHALDAYDHVSANSLKVLGKTLSEEVKEAILT